MGEFTVIFILGAIVALDTTSAGQLMISQPIVIAPAAGYFLGYPEAGIFIGTVMQLLWLKLIPAGGSIYLNGNMGSLAAIAAFCLSEQSVNMPEKSLIFVSLIFGILVSYVSGYFTLFNRKSNERLVHWSHQLIDNGRTGMFQLTFLSGLILKAVVGGFLTVIFALSGKIGMQMPSGVFLSGLSEFAPYGILALYGLGLGTVFSMVWDKKFWYLPIAGLLLCSTSYIL